MEQLTAFFTSDVGRMLCYAFAFIGVIDIFTAQVFLGSKLKKLEQPVSPLTLQEERHKIEKRVSGLRSVINIITFSGLAFIAVAVFGLTR